MVDGGCAVQIMKDGTAPFNKVRRAMEPGKRYTCANCKETFLSGWSEAAAEKEYAEHFGHLPKAVREDRTELCEDCYRKFMKWMRQEWRKSCQKATLKN